MFNNYLKTAWRNLIKSKGFSFINILGLTIGITVCMMIFLFIMNEFSVDNFHAKGKKIFRVMRHFKTEGKPGEVSFLSGLHAPALLNDFKGEIAAAVRVDPDQGLVTIDNRSFTEKNIATVDSNFFHLFTFPLIKGNANDVLKHPNSVVLTETTAKKYFRTINNAMGKVITLNKMLQLKITGIAKDVPSNSHLNFDLVVPISNYKERGIMTNWTYNGLFTYVLLNDHVTPQQ